MWILQLGDERLYIMKSYANVSYCSFKCLDVWPTADAKPMAHAGGFSTVPIAVKSIPDTVKRGYRQKGVKFPHQAGSQPGNPYSLRHDLQLIISNMTHSGGKVRSRRVAW